MSATLPTVQPAFTPPAGAPLPTQTTTTQTQVSPSPVKVTVTQLVGGEALVTAQQVGDSSCLCASDVQPIPHDPEGTIQKLDKVIAEASEPGSSTSLTNKYLAQARAELAAARASVSETAPTTGTQSTGPQQAAPQQNAGPQENNGNAPFAGPPAGNGVHTPQGVSPGSVSVFA